MAKTPKFPNPEFWKAKDNIDWKKQWENLKVCGGIFFEMFKETDWEKFAEGWKNTLKMDAARIKEEYQAFMASSTPSSTARSALAAFTQRAQWRPYVVSGAALRTPHMTSMSGPVCGVCSL